jgi:hypothetical protein
MALPSNATVTIDGSKFNAMSAHVGISTAHDQLGMPLMGTLQTAIAFVVDMHDNLNMPYATLQKLFNLANIVTKDKIKDVKVEFWADESQADALCTYSFKGWISEFSTGSGGGSNHTLSLRVQPALDQKNFIDLTLGN